ncbi:hypothetical protein SDC9_127094 [bioreactor metagenome]|uniref:Uncharacterized protein n=1 Tax=bioreactor metagenome TaxID=1076179 RepID=A0A645CT35_9ZZZZ
MFFPEAAETVQDRGYVDLFRFDFFMADDPDAPFTDGSMDAVADEGTGADTPLQQSARNQIVQAPGHGNRRGFEMAGQNPVVEEFFTAWRSGALQVFFQHGGDLPVFGNSRRFRRGIGQIVQSHHGNPILGFGNSII